MVLCKDFITRCCGKKTRYKIRFFNFVYKNTQHNGVFLFYFIEIPDDYSSIEKKWFSYAV